MISQLKGIVDFVAGNQVTLDVGGVGYQVHCSSGCLESLEIGKPARITVYTCVREDSITLFGFEDPIEKQVFLLLISVQGVGPKSGAEIISQIDKLDLLRTIGSGDASQLQRIKGVGKKLSERIIVELKDKVAEFAEERSDRAQDKVLTLSGRVTSIVDDAVAAMEALGFQRKDAERAVAQASQGGKISQSGQLVKEALRFV